MIAQFENELIAAQNQRAKANQVRCDTPLHAVNSIQGGPTEGPDSKSQDAIVYVHENGCIATAGEPRRPLSRTTFVSPRIQPSECRFNHPEFFASRWSFCARISFEMRLFTD